MRPSTTHLRLAVSNALSFAPWILYSPVGLMHRSKQLLYLYHCCVHRFPQISAWALVLANIPAWVPWVLARPAWRLLVNYSPAHQLCRVEEMQTFWPSPAAGIQAQTLQPGTSTPAAGAETLTLFFSSLFSPVVGTCNCDHEACAPWSYFNNWSRHSFAPVAGGRVSFTFCQTTVAGPEFIHRMTTVWSPHSSSVCSYHLQLCS